ncbi:F0F1 ATP synthase subunit epsilon [Staphylococcus carnosus]|uniref:ATP synthase epsilon chain n=2 Tax=Staphylococcus carnosus TaxID=1281 RepID=A0AAJ0NGE0_STACA|nr:F0F1 ATP synthase subunit epsilon [Staphylococcus carnosus]KKB24510.1 ATP synthase F0F1 subunit epsilon [Staphylococcus carnosus]QQS84767.1 F0F1 ATP synthase subunit epsilon [Staphylococcus carnosus]QRQ04705.1 F0F1 ATP synthase subunit epsilon [Staphylococcus carnosus]UTB83297.1 F0F1 ATP synthase subunit epsilon [Staphylococcus carnosus]UTC00052.1 F0F1 ATP synthase subunit epsilon [Staphylococcus carnosus]
MNTMNVNIVTPNGSVYNQDNVEITVLQTVGGDMGVMYGHIPTVTAIHTGYVKVHYTDGIDYIAVSDGFVEIRQEETSIIVQTAEKAEDIDVRRAESAKERAESHLNNNDEDTDINRAKRALERAENRLKVSDLLK